MPEPTFITSLISGSLRPSKVVIWTVSVLLVFGIGFLDFFTGYEISFVLFYSLPILLTVWYVDTFSAVFIAVLCTFVWWWGDEANGHPYTQAWFQVWETIVRLSYFLLFVLIGSALKSRIALLEHSRQLEQEIIRISEREQERIGRDLHDGICQYFAAVGCAAGSLRRSLEKQGVAQVDRAAEIEDLVMKGVGQTRSLARGLFPVENDEEGLQSALQELAENATRLLNMRCEFECDEPVAVFDNTCATHLYRIAQESISNASRHGRAKYARIRLSAHDQHVSLEVSDDGVGMPSEKSKNRGLGLGIMRYRARMIDGQFSITSQPGQGTTVSCSFDQRSRPHV